MQKECRSPATARSISSLKICYAGRCGGYANNVQQGKGNSVERGTDQVYTAEAAAEAAMDDSIDPQVEKLP